MHEIVLSDLKGTSTSKMILELINCWKFKLWVSLCDNYVAKVQS